MATLTIRNLDEDVKRRLRLRGAENGRSMEAEARAILAQSILASGPVARSRRPEASLRRAAGPFAHLVGRWKGRIATDALMRLTRGED